MAEWIYSGDVNAEHGGAWFDLSTFAEGYVSAVRVTDLDSAIGFDGACEIEHVVIVGTTDKKRVKDALRCCGINFSEWSNRSNSSNRNKQHIRLAIADALLSYGCYDPDDRAETVQMEQDGSMKFDGWRATKRLHGTDLRAYVESVHLD